MQMRFSSPLHLLPAIFLIIFAILAPKVDAAAGNLNSLGLNLIGVVAFQDERRAMVSLTGMEEEVLISEGDLIEGYTVRRIEKDQMELAKDGHIQTLVMKAADPAQSPAADTKIYAASPAETPAATPAPIKRLASTRSLKRVLARVPVKSSPVKIASISSSGRPRFIRPTNVGYVSSSYGYRIHPTRSRVGGTYSMHRGTDIAAPIGSPVLAAADGVVSVSGWTWAKGNYIEIKHSGGYTTAYFHLTKRNVKVGQSVSSGQSIGTVGNTGISSGPHLHFELHINGSAVNPANYVRSLNTR